MTQFPICSVFLCTLYKFAFPFVNCQWFSSRHFATPALPAAFLPAGYAPARGAPGTWSSSPAPAARTHSAPSVPAARTPRQPRRPGQVRLLGRTRPRPAPPRDSMLCHVVLRPRPLSRAPPRGAGQPWRDAGPRSACSPLCPACSRFPRPGAHPRRGSRRSRLPPGRLWAGSGAAPSGSFRPRASAARSLTEATGDAGGSGAEGPVA